jgi:hypothetical protein
MDIKKRVVVPMVNRTTGNVDFEIIVYGYSLFEMYVTSHPVISSLARRYPDHMSSPFMLKDGKTLFNPKDLVPRENSAPSLVGFAALR